jgi:hypothetical protein
MIDMQNQLIALKDEARMLNNMALKLKAMSIEIQEMNSKFERLSFEKLNLAKELDAKIRLENLKIYKVRVKRPLRKHQIKVYSYWYASWRINSKVKNVCLGSTERMTHDEALTKAQKLKAVYMGIILQ